MFHNVWTNAIVTLLTAAALALLWRIRGWLFSPESWLRRVDDRVADWCDAVADFVWSWTGVSRKRQREFAISSTILIWVADAIGRHSWVDVGLLSMVFFGSFVHRSSGSSVFEFLHFVLRIWVLACFVFFLSVSIPLLVIEFHKWPGYAAANIALALLLFYMYLSYERPRPKERRRRHPISELVRLFGAEWVREVPKAG